jgi:hypothetical protein
MNKEILKFENDLFKNVLGQVAMVVPNWKKAILPWMQLGK